MDWAGGMVRPARAAEPGIWWPAGALLEEWWDKFAVKATGARVCETGEVSSY